MARGDKMTAVLNALAGRTQVTDKTFTDSTCTLKPLAFGGLLGRQAQFSRISVHWPYGDKNLESHRKEGFTASPLAVFRTLHTYARHPGHPVEEAALQAAQALMPLPRHVPKAPAAPDRGQSPSPAASPKAA